MRPTLYQLSHPGYPRMRDFDVWMVLVVVEFVCLWWLLDDGGEMGDRIHWWSSGHYEVEVWL